MQQLTPGEIISWGKYRKYIVVSQWKDELTLKSTETDMIYTGVHKGYKRVPPLQVKTKV